MVPCLSEGADVLYSEKVLRDIYYSSTCRWYTQTRFEKIKRLKQISCF